MGRQIIKQPNGKFAVWSSIVEDFILLDVSPAEIIEEFVEDSRETIETRVTEIINTLERGEKPYSSFTRTFDQIIDEVKDRHGDNTESLTYLREQKII